MSSDEDSSPTVINSIIWDNADSTGTGTQESQIFYFQAPPVVRHSCVQGDRPGGAARTRR